MHGTMKVKYVALSTVRWNTGGYSVKDRKKHILKSRTKVMHSML